MTRLILPLILTIATFSAPPAFSKEWTWVTQAEVEAAYNGDTCKHYVNRARFKHRHPDQEFVVTLADSCLSAQASLKSENLSERTAAKEFLIRLRL